ncbi:MAG TPA: hypothetical protein VMY06_10715 [Sedimentisphaerales bacterium]|nr:hypothetical protein [Sedimentisphaerales bacterium]
MIQTDISRWAIIRVLRWFVVLLAQLIVLCIIGLRIGSALTIRADPYVDWFFDTVDVFVLPVGFLMTLNIIALMVDGRRFAKWPWWRVFLTYFAMGIPVYAFVYYWRSEQELLRLQEKPSESPRPSDYSNED